MQSKSALGGYRVIDMTQLGVGPTATGLLAQWGAEVIHLESPQGDVVRGHNRTPGSSRPDEEAFSCWWQQPNMNKKSLTLDLNYKEGREVLHKLIATADVFLGNLRPYELKKFDLEYETMKKINPKLIYAIFNGYGIEGPDKDEAGYDVISFFARSGIMHMMSGEDGIPVMPRAGLGDIPTGMYLACGVVVALLARERLGIGQEVYVSLLASGIWSNPIDSGEALAFNKDGDRMLRGDALNPIRNTYKTKDDRWILMNNMQGDRFWKLFCQVIEREDLEKDPRFDTAEKRAENHSELIKIINEVFAGKTYEEWNKRLAHSGLVWSPVQKPTEAVKDPQARANGSFVSFDFPKFGTYELLAPPQRLMGTPPTFRTPAPRLGEHNEELLLELGYSRDDIGSLREKKVIV
jgi:crotonobetainyl-CoA:carnitine CoA-transferase CaiB-like acyl-CoA transferase